LPRKTPLSTHSLRLLPSVVLSFPFLVGSNPGFSFSNTSHLGIPVFEYHRSDDRDHVAAQNHQIVWSPHWKYFPRTRGIVCCCGARAVFVAHSFTPGVLRIPLDARLNLFCENPGGKAVRSLPES